MTFFATDRTQPWIIMILLQFHSFLLKDFDLSSHAFCLKLFSTACEQLQLVNVSSLMLNKTNMTALLQQFSVCPLWSAEQKENSQWVLQSFKKIDFPIWRKAKTYSLGEILHIWQHACCFICIPYILEKAILKKSTEFTLKFTFSFLYKAQWTEI